MIFDKITNIDKYDLPKTVKEFVKIISDDIEIGRHSIDEDNYASVNIYKTKKHSDCKLEAHKKYIDIQLLLSGNERLDYTDIKGLKISQDYDAARDLVFYNTPNCPLNSVQLEKGVFAVLYPNEAHMPQMDYDENSCEVKKVVVKIKID